MKTKIAVAMALVVVGFGVGLSPAPFAAAQSSDCMDDFEIGATPQTRTLPADSSEVGHREVFTLTGDEDLKVTLETGNDLLEWNVSKEDSQGNCVDYSQGGCDGTNQINTKDQTQSCTLNAPSSGSIDYFVLFVNPQDDPLDYTVEVD